MYIVEAALEDSETWILDSICIGITVVWAIISDLRWRNLGFATLQVSSWGFLILSGIGIAGYFIGTLGMVFILPWFLAVFLPAPWLHRQCHVREVENQGDKDGGGAL
jgi:hypothetical protein